MYKNYSPEYVIKLAKKMRGKMTPAEKILWSKLCKKQLNGFRFRRQHSISRYIADFYCHEIKLIIEIDGNIHDKRKEYDNNRDKFLEAGGFTVLRFHNNEITNSLDSVLGKIKKCTDEILKR